MKIPQLEILELEAILVHEWYDNQRTRPLCQRLQQSGTLRNPPIVTPTKPVDFTGDDPQSYIVLDGANRVAALRVLGYPHILAQVVDPRDPGLRLRTWNHVLLDIEPTRLIAALRQIPRLSLSCSGEVYFDLPSRPEVGVGIIQTRDGEVYALSAPEAGLPGRIEILNAVVNCYQHISRLDRTTFTELGPLLPLYPERDSLPSLSALVIFPKFDILELIQVASAGWLLPPGITRTTVSPRALHVNFSLAELASPGTLPEKNARLQELLQQRFAARRVKYYAEPTFLFDE